MEPSLWTQNYTPIGGSLWLSTLVTLIPMVFFFVALVGLRMRGYIAGGITVVLAFLVAIVGYHMPIDKALWSMGYGFAYGLWPISWIIISAIFLYKLSVKTGQFNVIRQTILSITRDQRLLVVLIGFSFEAFLEGAAGFGASVAIAASLLVGLGFNPLYAAGLCLISDTAPVAFGALGIPITVSASVTGIPAITIAQVVGRQLPLLAFFIPFFMVYLMDARNGGFKAGIKGVREVLPALLVAGLSFSVTQFFVSNFVGPELPDIASALVSLLATSLFLRTWQPAVIQPMPSSEALEASYSTGEPLTTKRIIGAWSPFLLLTVFVVIWSLPVFQGLFNAKEHGPLAALVYHLDVPTLHNQVVKVAPIVEQPTPYAATYKWDWLSATGTAIFTAALFSMVLSRVKLKDGLEVFGDTLKELLYPILTIMFVLGFAYISNYSGQSSTLALALAQSGHFFPLFSPILGWLGVFLTGSDASANALFSGLQQVTAQQLGINPALTVAANTTGGVTAKMISPQSIAIAAAAVGLIGREGELLRFTFKKSLVFLSIIIVITALQAYVVPGMLPHP